MVLRLASRETVQKVNYKSIVDSSKDKREHWCTSIIAAIFTTSAVRTKCTNFTYN